MAQLTGAAITVAVAHKRFPGAAAPLFADLRLDAAPGQVLALIGPSGVGKSSLLRMIAGLDRDFDGTITVDGHPAGTGPLPGFVFQDPRLLPWASALGNIRAVSPATGDTQARALLAEMGLGGFEHALPAQLSGGMQRRVALARALSVAPRLLLLDEPFVSLDRALARELAGVVARLVATRGPTVVLVTHEVEDAARLADRVVRLAGSPARIAGDDLLPLPRDQRSEGDVRAMADRLSGETTA